MKQQEAVSNKPQWRIHTENGTSDSEWGILYKKKKKRISWPLGKMLHNGGSVIPCGEEQELVTAACEGW